jgi:hypothetical protein
MGIDQRMPLAADCPMCRVIASHTHKHCQESPSTETWGINIGDPMVNTHYSVYIITIRHIKFGLCS